jgi:phosphonate transport system substrate-binding protein
MKKVLSVFIALFLVIALFACNGDSVNPEVLEVQLIPSRDAAVLDAQRAPLEALLEAELDMEVNVTVATDYNALIEAMKSGQVHVGLLATASYVLAHEEGAAEVILKSLRYDVDDEGNLLTDQPLVSGYKSQLVVAADSGIESVADLEGKKIAIASFTSTSGFVWPANLLADNDLDPMTDVTWINAGGHDSAILAVYNGQADAAFTFKDARTLVEGDYPDVYDKVEFVANTEPIPNDTISVIPNLNRRLVERIKDAFIAISQSEEGLAIIRAVYNHEGYAEATDDEYDIVRTYLERQEEWEFE